MQQNLVKQKTTAEILGMQPGVMESLPPIVQGWAQMAAIKVGTFAELQNEELAIQNILNAVQYKGATYPVAQLCVLAENEQVATVENVQQLNERLTIIQSAIAEAKRLVGISKERRLAFTSRLNEMVIEPAMSFEKRSIVLLDTVSQSETAFRVMVSKLNGAVQYKSSELASLETHIVNEHSRIAVQYRNTLTTMIGEAYSTALRGKTPPAEIENYKLAVIELMKGVKLAEFQRFNRTYVNDTEAYAVFQKVRPYESASDFHSAVNALHNKFAMYEHDLKNAESAIAANENETKNTVTANSEQASIDASINNLAAQAGTMTMSNAPKVKVLVEVAVENSDNWLLAVMAAFMKNFTSCREFVSVKNVEKLTVAQMATALGKFATKSNQSNVAPGAIFAGLTLKIIEK